MRKNGPFVKKNFFFNSHHNTAQEIADLEKALQVRAGVEENNRKRRKIEREVIQAIVLRVHRNQGRRRRHIEERNPHQAQDQDREVQVEKFYIKSPPSTQPERAANKNRASLFVHFFLLFIKKNFFFRFHPTLIL